MSGWPLCLWERMLGLQGLLGLWLSREGVGVGGSAGVFLVISTTLVILNITLVNVKCDFNKGLGHSQLGPIRRDVENRFADVSVTLSSTSIVVSPSNSSGTCTIYVRSNGACCGLGMRGNVLGLDRASHHG